MSNRDGNKRFNFTLGGGSARVELQSFQGDIHVSRGPLEPQRQRRKGALHFRHNGIEGGGATVVDVDTHVDLDADVDVDVDIDVDIDDIDVGAALEAPIVAVRVAQAQAKAVAKRVAKTRVVRRD
jgi:hypothetical protein